MIGKSISHYKILEKLGEGGMGVVYKAEDTDLKRTVALKFLSSQALGGEEEMGRFIHEAQSAASLDHPSICTVHEINKAEEHTFIVMAYVEGQSLKGRIESGPLKLDEVVDLAIQVAEGLQAAHEKGVVHRDIKPANIMVIPKGQAKIMDFGLVKAPGRTELTKKGMTLGTAAYMSPEQARGGEIDHRTDIWSLGIVLYEMVTGQRPFKGDHEPAVVYSILNETQEPVTALRTGVPMELERVITRCVEKNAEDRYQTADDLASDLRRVKRVIAKPSTRSRSAAISTEGARPGRRWPLVAALSVVAVLALIVFRPYFVPSRKESAEQPTEQPVSERKMLVVLPFENLGPAEDEYFADGLTEEITSRLAAVHGLGVISRASAGQYKGTGKTIKQIGDELGVDFVLGGTVRWDRASGSESRVRITPQLIKVSDDTHLWSKPYDRVIDDIFAVQTDIAEQVFQQLDVRLLEPELRALEAQPTGNFEAYQAYLRGLDYAGRADWLKEDMFLAVQMFERAVKLDPAFALAYAELSQAYSMSYHFGHDRTEECLSNAKAAVDRAFELDPELPDVHLALGYYHYWGYREYDLALEALAMAQESLPNDAGILKATGYVQRRQGHFEAGLENLKRAFALSPRDAGLVNEIAETYMFLRRYEEAERYYDTSISLAPDQTEGYLLKAWNYWFWEGDTEKAGVALEEMPQKALPSVLRYLFRQKILERDYTAALDRLSSTSIETFKNTRIYIPKPLYAGLSYQLMDKSDLARVSYDDARGVLENVLKDLPDDARVHSSLGIAYAGLGRKDEAIREGKLAVALYPPSKDAIFGPVLVRELAYIHVMVGEYEAAMDQIEYLVSIPNHALSVPFLRLDPRCDPIRSHPRFQRLLEESPAVGS